MWKFRVLLYTTSLAPGPLLLLVYKYFFSDNGFSLGVTAEKTNISLIVSTFSFTMLGFLAATITIFFGISGKRVLDRYKSNGHLTTFLFFYALAIICLCVTFCFSIISLAKNVPLFFFDYMMASLVNNLFHTLLLTYVVINLVHKGYKKEPPTEDPMPKAKGHY